MSLPSEYHHLFKPLIDALGEAKTVFLTVHLGPDGDALGAMLAFRHGLAQGCPQLERIDCVMAGKMPDDFLFLPAVDEVVDIEKDHSLLPQYDIAISLDCGAGDRLGPVEPLFHGAKISANVDHHVSNKHFAKLNIVIPQAAASGEVVADILDEMGIALTKEIATCVYTALVTDTGGFKYSNANSKVYRLAARCIDVGIDHEEIYKQVYEQRPKAKALLQADAVCNASFNEENTLAWVEITRDMRDRNGALEEHTDGIVDALRQIDTVVLAAVFKEGHNGSTRVSFRSDDHTIDVSEIAGRFGGGGHKMASGCTIEGDIEAAKSKILPLLREKLPQKATP